MNFCYFIQQFDLEILYWIVVIRLFSNHKDSLQFAYLSDLQWKKYKILIIFVTLLMLWIFFFIYLNNFWIKAKQSNCFFISYHRIWVFSYFLFYFRCFRCLVFLTFSVRFFLLLSLRIFCEFCPCNCNDFFLFYFFWKSTSYRWSVRPYALLNIKFTASCVFIFSVFKINHQQ